MPKVSVIIPTYNRFKYLCEAIDSVLNQTYKDFELIVVDDGSTDDTAKVLKEKYGSRIKYFYKQQGGPPNAMNYGVRKSSGEYFVVLGDDDGWMENYLEIMVPVIESNPELAFISSGSYLMNGESAVLRELQNGKNYERSFAGLLKWNFVFHLTALVRRKHFEEMNGFDEQLRTTHDYDLWLRLTIKYPFKYVDKPLGKYRVHGSNVTRELDTWLNDHLRILEKKEVKNHLTLFQRLAAKAGYYFKFARFYEEVKLYKKAGDCFAKALLSNPVIGVDYWPPECKKMKFSLPYRILKSFTLPFQYCFKK